MKQMSLKSYYVTDRVKQVDQDFLEFEELKISEDDKKAIQEAKEKQIHFSHNPYNSILLYVCGLTDDFDFKRGRSQTTGGASPDVDLDFPASQREDAIAQAVEMWGREQIANIGTVSVFKLKLLTKRFFKITAPATNVTEHWQIYKEVYEKIPPKLFGKDATLEEMLKGDPDKGYKAHPELEQDPRYRPWLDFCRSMEGMVNTTGSHAAGIIITEEPTYNYCPVWKSGKAARTTQFDMHDAEEIGLLKLDYLGIVNLDIITECCKLIKERHKVDIDIYKLEDFEPEAYRLFDLGLIQGIFQFETSTIAQSAVVRAKCRSITELGDITSLIRPGPAQAGYLRRYLENDPDMELPEAVRKFLGTTRQVLTYQEQLQGIFAKFCNWSLEQADEARKAVGKKKEKDLMKLEPRFMKDFQQYGGFSKTEAQYLWKVILGCGDYLFNKSHAISYSYLSYICAYLKGLYPLEFYTALLSVRGSTKSDDWDIKASEYVADAKILGIQILPPSILYSDLNFTISKRNIYFGLGAIKSVKRKVLEQILKIRKLKQFSSIEDFISRVEVDAGTLQALISAGAFDQLGYDRTDLLNNVQTLAHYLAETLKCHEHNRAVENRAAERAALDSVLGERDLLIKESTRSKNPRILTESEQAFVDEHKLTRRPVLLKTKELPTLPALTRSSSIALTIDQQIKQARYIGCFLGQHPVHTIFPRSTPIIDALPVITDRIAGDITEIKITHQKANKEEMAFITISDGTASARIVFFAYVWKRLKAQNLIPEVGDLVEVGGDIESEETQVQMKGRYITIYSGTTNDI